MLRSRVGAALVALLFLAVPGVALADAYVNVVTNGDDAIGVTGRGSCGIVVQLNRSSRKQSCSGAGSIVISRMPARYVTTFNHSMKQPTREQQLANTRICEVSIWKSGGPATTTWHTDFGKNEEHMCRAKWLNGNTLEVFVNRSSQSNLN